MFVYGCACALGSTLGAITVFRYGGLPPNLHNNWALYVIFVWFVLPYAFKSQFIPQYYIPLEDRWQPVLSVTRTRILLARWLLGLALLSLVGFVIWVALAKSLLSLSMSLCQLGFLSGIYQAMHWGFRAENLFPPRLARIVWFPLGEHWPR
jgi:hypothetical protein